eukprot:TRINITY_DN16952_c0_g1_i1.p1 TRINITY_DN16952_c0_g1~~TRINITY_DN16952_c0_g1_i1.p1  ORF type:complete len:786 (+),score=109.40 TRINITY_DN16952_c0_g1_i1:176-2533(+)
MPSSALECAACHAETDRGRHGEDLLPGQFFCEACWRRYDSRTASPTAPVAPSWPSAATGDVSVAADDFKQRSRSRKRGRSRSRRSRRTRRRRRSKSRSRTRRQSRSNDKPRQASSAIIAEKVAACSSCGHETRTGDFGQGLYRNFFYCKSCWHRYSAAAVAAGVAPTSAWGREIGDSPSNMRPYRRSAQDDRMDTAATHLEALSQNPQRCDDNSQQLGVAAGSLQPQPAHCQSCHREAVRVQCGEGQFKHRAYCENCWNSWRGTTAHGSPPGVDGVTGVAASQHVIAKAARHCDASLACADRGRTQPIASGSEEGSAHAIDDEPVVAASTTPREGPPEARVVCFNEFGGHCAVVFVNVKRGGQVFDMRIRGPRRETLQAAQRDCVELRSAAVRGGMDPTLFMVRERRRSLESTCWRDRDLSDKNLENAEGPPPRATTRSDRRHCSVTGAEEAWLPKLPSVTDADVEAAEVPDAVAGVPYTDEWACRAKKAMQTTFQRFGRVQSVYFGAGDDGSLVRVRLETGKHAEAAMRAAKRGFLKVIGGDTAAIVTEVRLRQPKSDNPLWRNFVFAPFGASGLARGGDGTERLPASACDPCGGARGPCGCTPGAAMTGGFTSAVGSPLPFAPISPCGPAAFCPNGVGLFNAAMWGFGCLNAFNIMNGFAGAAVAAAAAASAAACASQGQQDQHRDQKEKPVVPEKPSLTELGSDASEVDIAVRNGEEEVAREMAALVGLPVSEQRKLMRNLRIRWHPDKNPESPEVATRVFQFVQAHEPWMAHLGIGASAEG